MDKNGMIKINGGSNWIHFAMVPPPKTLNNHMRLQECTTQNQLNDIPHRTDLLNIAPPLPSASSKLPQSSTGKEDLTIGRNP